MAAILPHIEQKRHWRFYGVANFNEFLIYSNHTLTHLAHSQWYNYPGIELSLLKAWFR